MLDTLQPEQLQDWSICNPRPTPPIRVESDAQGLHLAARELFEEAFAEEMLKPTLALLDGDPEQRDRVREDIPERTLSAGYYTRARYLMELGAAIEIGAQYSAASLSHADVVGLLAVKRAKSQFEHDHPSCGACGTRQDNRFMRECKSCKVKFAGRAD
jgi:hypothetical protein